ncbi:hypothetical protein ACFL2R_02740 [Patescibacteria group bacterium]
MLSPDKIGRVVRKASDMGCYAGFLCLIVAAYSLKLEVDGSELAAVWGYVFSGLFLCLCIFLFVVVTMVDTKLREFRGKYDSIWTPSKTHIQNLTELLGKEDCEIEIILRENLSWKGLSIPISEIDINSIKERLTGELAGYQKIIQEFSEFEVSWQYRVCQFFAVGVK